MPEGSRELRWLQVESAADPDAVDRGTFDRLRRQHDDPVPDRDEVTSQEVVGVVRLIVPVGRWLRRWRGLLGR